MMQYRHLKNKVIMNLREIILTNLLQFIKDVYSTVDECGVEKLDFNRCWMRSYQKVDELG